MDLNAFVETQQTPALEAATAEGRLLVKSCLNCERVFGEPTIDYHQGLAHPPEPYPLVTYSIWDPQRRRFTIPAIPTPEE